MLDNRVVTLMQRLIDDGAASTPKNATSMRLHDDFRLGRLKGKSLLLTERDRAEMAELLQARGFATHPVDLSAMTRAERLQSGSADEKAGGGTIKNHRISIKALAGQALRICGRRLDLPPRAHLDVDWQTLTDIEHGCVMLVENYEDFDRLHEHRFDLPPGFDEPLAVYRGDRHESRQDNVLAFLRSLDLPTIAFVDIDPKGLHIAQSCPRLHGIVAPSADDLTSVLANPKSARPDLYTAQIVALENFFATVSPASPTNLLWQHIARYRSGAIQERWRADATSCVLWIAAPRSDSATAS